MRGIKALGSVALIPLHGDLILILKLRVFVTFARDEIFLRELDIVNEKKWKEEKTGF